MNLHISSHQHELIQMNIYLRFGHNSNEENLVGGTCQLLILYFQVWDQIGLVWPIFTLQLRISVYQRNTELDHWWCISIFISWFSTSTQFKIRDRVDPASISQFPFSLKLSWREMVIIDWSKTREGEGGGYLIRGCILEPCTNYLYSVYNVFIILKYQSVPVCSLL